MKVVLDTNVIMSGLFFGGVPAEILLAWRRGTITIVVSSEILEEYWATGARLAERFPPVNPAPFLRLVSAGALLVKPHRLLESACDDPDDDKFLECAIASTASAIVTGDKALLRLSPFRGIPIVKPRALAEGLFRT
ncbi:MAG: putative toxin-antitoxin system toxin component, PIN family [Gemmatimonadetes bacterium]|nr:putative toxin-antitoxin system toxin component, PIN family [Gemmatimonadota bacterium]